MQFTKISKEKSEKATAIRAYYEANLKLKLFKFLHESNIEFIEHRVKVEEFFGYRKRMRLMFKVLQKNARVEIAQSSFSKIPTSGAIYMIHRWISDIFGEEAEQGQITVKDRVQYQNRRVISMKNVNVENRLSKRYVAKQRNADILLHHYYTKSIFKVMKREYRVVKKLSTGVRGRLLSKVLTEWQRYSIERTQKKV